MSIAKKSKLKAKTLWALFGTAAAYALPYASAALGVDPSVGPMIGTVSGVGIPAGLILAAIARITSTHSLR